MLAPLGTVLQQNPDFHEIGYLLMHRAIIKDIRDMAQAANRFESLSREDSVRLNNWFKFYWDMLEMHHTEEDERFFPFIFERVPSIVKDFDRLSEDHTKFNSLVEQIGGTLQHLQELNQGQERSTLTRQIINLLATFRDMLEDHLEREEGLVIPALAKNFTAVEQQGLGNATMQNMPLEHLSSLVPWVLSSLDADTEGEAIKILPPEIQHLYYSAWKEEYQKFSAVLKVA